MNNRVGAKAVDTHCPCLTAVSIFYVFYKIYIYQYQSNEKKWETNYFLAVLNGINSSLHLLLRVSAI